MKKLLHVEQLDPQSGAPLSVSPLTWSHATFVTTVRLPEEVARAVLTIRGDRVVCRGEKFFARFGLKPAGDAKAEPGGFTAISRWSSEAIPPGRSPGYHRDATGPIPPGRHRADTTGHRDFNGGAMLY